MIKDIQCSAPGLTHGSNSGSSSSVGPLPGFCTDEKKKEVKARLEREMPHKISGAARGYWERETLNNLINIWN